MRAISTLVVSAGLVLCGASAFAQQVDPSQLKLMSSTFTSDQLSADTSRLNAAAAAPTTSVRPTETSSDTSFATPAAAGNASLSVTGENVSALESSAPSSMAGVDASSVATGNLHAFTTSVTPPVLGR